ncbi:MAG: metallophosphoesterase [Kofleriaceae bacterium]
MWFLLLAIGLALLISTGLYARRRIANALHTLGVASRTVTIARWMIVWLLFGYPVLVIASIVTSRVRGEATLPRFDGTVASWLLGFPFAWALLVVLQSALWLLAIDLGYLVLRRRRGPGLLRVRAIAVLIAVGVFAIYTPVRIVVERGDVRVRHHQLTVAQPSTNPPFRIAFIADIQQDDHTDADRAREVYGIVNASRPDVVLSGGDWINTGPDQILPAAEAAETLTSRLGTFSVLGDHEHFAYVDRERSLDEIEQAMTRHGIAMVDNEVRWFEHHGKRIGVVLLNYNYIHRSDADTVAKLVASVADADYSIVVTHQLDRALAAQLENKVDLVLAAHTHGGQVNPVVGVVHVNLARIETPWVDGRYQLGTTAVIATAGVGYSIIPIRYAAPGSIELIELRL